MASIDCVIDTTPMAKEIATVSNHVNATTTAVVAMKTAVIAAEKQAADHVCDNVNNGFYNLIRSQISQKTAKLQSEVDSHLMKLGQQRRQLLALKDRMERDYHMITARYLKLFNSINRNLKQRVLELDRPTFDFAVGEMAKINNRQYLLTADVPLSQNESVACSQKILVSNLKMRSNSLINSMTRFISQSEEQKALSDRILVSGADGNANLSIPVLISETLVDKKGNSTVDIVVDEQNLPTPLKAAVKNTISMTTSQLAWNDKNKNDEVVANEFNKLLAKSSASTRVKNMMDKMFSSNHYQTLKNS